MNTKECHTLRRMIQKCFEEGLAEYLPSHDNDKRAAVMTVDCGGSSLIADTTQEDQREDSGQFDEDHENATTVCQEEPNCKKTDLIDNAAPTTPNDELTQVQQDSSPTSLTVPKESSQVQYDVVKHMKKIPSLVSMFDYLSISKPTRRMLEMAMADIAEKLGRREAV